MSTTLAPRLRYHESLFNEPLEGCKSGVYKGIAGMHVSVALVVGTSPSSKVITATRSSDFGIAMGRLAIARNVCSVV